MSRRVCAIDFTTNSIHVLVRRGSRRFEAMEADLPGDAIRDGKVMEPVAVQLYLTRMLRALKVKFPEIRLAVSDSACVTRFLDYPRVRPKDLGRSLRIEAERELPMNPRDSYIAWQVVEKNGSRQTVMLVAAWRDVVEGYLEAIEGLGRVTVVEPRSLALTRAVGEPDAVLMDWTGDRIQVAIVENGRVSYTNSVLVADGAGSSMSRLLHLMASLIPKAAGRRAPIPPRLVLLGELHGREEVGRALGGEFDIIADWCPEDPYQKLASAAQVANIGLLLRR